MRGLEIYLFGYTELEIVRKLANEIFIKHGENYTVHLKKKKKKVAVLSPARVTTVKEHGRHGQC